MLLRLTVPTHQRELSSLADVTHPVSVIERDANPAPLQSLVVGGGGWDREGYWERHEEESWTQQTKGVHASRQTRHWSGQVAQVLSWLTNKTRHTSAYSLSPGILKDLGLNPSKLRPGGQKPLWGLCRGGMLWELLTSSCTPSCVLCTHWGGVRLHHCGAVPRRGTHLSDCKWGVRTNILQELFSGWIPLHAFSMSPYELPWKFTLCVDIQVEYAK